LLGLPEGLGDLLDLAEQLATGGSTEPLAPLAPASLVASLKSWCRCGYFSKCGGLK